jgi:hypothetical protein
MPTIAGTVVLAWLLVMGLPIFDCLLTIDCQFSSDDC